MKIMRASNRNGYGWVEGRKEGVKNDQENWRRKRWGRGAILNSNNKQQSLGVYWTRSGVVIPLPCSSDNHHALVSSINNNIYYAFYSEFRFFYNIVFIYFSYFLLFLLLCTIHHWQINWMNLQT